MNLLNWMVVTTHLFGIALVGILANKKNVLIILMAIELMLLAINLNFIACSVYFDDMMGQLFAVFVLTVAAAESATGLAILVAYYRVRTSITLTEGQLLKG